MSSIPLSIIRQHWRRAFPDRWEKLVEMAAPFYSDDLNFDLKPARLTAESDLRSAMSKIAPGDVWRTPLGKKKMEKDSIWEFSSVVKEVQLVTTLPSRCGADAFRMIVSSHVGGFFDDRDRNLHPAFFGTSSPEPLDLHKRIADAFKKSVYATWPVSAKVKPRNIDPIILSVFAGAVSSILFMGLHFASVGDNSRDFSPLLKFLLAGNYPINVEYGKASKGVAEGTQKPLCSIVLLCRRGNESVPPVQLFPLTYSGLPWCRTQSGMLEPAKDVLGCHTPKRLAQGIIEPRPRPRLGSTETLLDLREHLLDRGVVRAVRRQR